MPCLQRLEDDDCSPQADSTPRSPVPLLDISESPMTKFLGLCPALTALDLMVVFWGRGQQVKERDFLPETDNKEDLSHLLGLWFRAVEASQQSGLPHFSSVEPHRPLRPTLGSSQMEFFSFENVLCCPVSTP